VKIREEVAGVICIDELANEEHIEQTTGNGSHPNATKVI
jgi:hypothetical protein